MVKYLLSIVIQATNICLVIITHFFVFSRLLLCPTYLTTIITITIITITIITVISLRLGFIILRLTFIGFILFFIHLTNPLSKLLSKLSQLLISFLIKQRMLLHKPHHSLILIIPKLHYLLVQEIILEKLHQNCWNKLIKANALISVLNQIG